MSSGMLAKYFGQQDEDLYGSRVAGHSIEGFPILGPYGTSHLKQHEMENLSLYNTFKAEWFRMWIPKEHAQYCKIMDHVSNGEFFIKNRFPVPVPDFPKDEPGGSIKIWLEWVQVSAKLPPDLAGTSPYPLPSPDTIAFNVTVPPSNGADYA